jgi:hypothetical protein
MAEFPKSADDAMKILQQWGRQSIVSTFSVKAREDGIDIDARKSAEEAEVVAQELWEAAFNECAKPAQAHDVLFHFSRRVFNWSASLRGFKRPKKNIVDSWLSNRRPAFQTLQDDERQAILNFTLVFSLFELEVFGTKSANADKLNNECLSWSPRLTLEMFAEEFDYFKRRYTENGDTNYLFDSKLRFNRRDNDEENVRCNDPDKKEVVKAILLNTNPTAVDIATACLIIAWRYRNNLFHGPKWIDDLHGARENLSHASGVITKALDLYWSI